MIPSAMDTLEPSFELGFNLFCQRIDAAVNIQQCSNNGSQNNGCNQDQHIFTAQASGYTNIYCAGTQTDHCSMANLFRYSFFEE